MVQIIGLMISGYIITRMISFITRSGVNQETNVARIFFAIHMIITAILTIGLIASGAKTPQF